MRFQYRVLGHFRDGGFTMNTCQDGLSLGSIKKLLFKEVYFVKKENAHA